MKSAGSFLSPERRKPTIMSKVWTNEYDFCVANSKADAESFIGYKCKRASWPKCSCGKPGETIEEKTFTRICDCCAGCASAEYAAESASLSYVESGGGSEMMNNVWASRMFGG